MRTDKFVRADAMQEPFASFTRLVDGSTSESFDERVAFLHADTPFSFLIFLARAFWDMEEYANGSFVTGLGR